MSWVPDEYAFRARIAPALLAVVPALPAIYATSLRVGLSMPSVSSVPASATTAVAVTTAAWLMLASQVGRAGRRKQSKLFHSWGGPPLLVALRRSDYGGESRSWARVRSMLAEKTGTPAPELDELTSDQFSADQAYADYQAELRSLTRDKSKFPRVFDENVNYGFRRNLWGLKAIAIAIAIASLAIGVALLWEAYPTVGKESAAVVALVVSIGALGVWWWLVTPAWVKETADAYVAAMLDGALRLIDEKEEQR